MFVRTLGIAVEMLKCGSTIRRLKPAEESIGMGARDVKGVMRIFS